MWKEIPERNRQILQMRKEGIRRSDVARKFNLSPSRIYLIEQQSRADIGTAERRVKLREKVVNADDLDALWAVSANSRRRPRFLESALGRFQGFDNQLASDTNSGKIYP